jgi:predicted GIY-YIG superfamily endonuclease
MEATTQGLHVRGSIKGLLNTIQEFSMGTRRSAAPWCWFFSQWFEQITDAIAAERQVKGWSRAKKEALIRGDFDQLRLLAKRRH